MNKIENQGINEGPPSGSAQQSPHSLPQKYNFPSNVSSLKGGPGLNPVPNPPAVNAPQVEKLDWFRNHFRPHFDDWVFGPIDRLVPSRDALVGFILMACAIDYLAGFLVGSSTKGKVGASYPSFIDEYFPKGRYDSEGLYDSLRNGLVHMFTIKDRKYALTHNNPELHLKQDSGGQIILNAADFRDDLTLSKEAYFSDVEANVDLLNKLLERYHRDGFLGPHPLRTT